MTVLICNTQNTYMLQTCISLVTCKSQEHVRYLQRYCKTLATWLYILYGCEHIV